MRKSERMSENQNIIQTGFLPISKLKAVGTAVEVLDENEFFEISKKTTFNPEQKIFFDEYKYWFYTDTTRCFFHCLTEKEGEKND